MSSDRQYAEAGVDIAERSGFAASLPAILARARRPEVIADAGPFSGLFRLGDRYTDPVLTASVDGIGTKAKLQMAAGRLDLCGPDILGHSVNDILACGAEPLFFLDYIAGSGLTTVQKTQLVEGMADACASVGCALIGGETADMPGVYAEGEFDIAGTIVGVVERDEIIDGTAISEGDVLLGLPSSGLHTNGFALARRVLEVALEESPAETRARLEERPDVLEGLSLGEALLATHRPYHQEVLPIRHLIKGMAHITGGGYAENIPRVMPEGLAAEVDTAGWNVPGIFELIRSRGEVTAEEMYEVFNMGIGLVLFIGDEDVDEATQAAPEAFRIGSVISQAGSQVVLRGI